MFREQVVAICILHAPKTCLLTQPQTRKTGSDSEIFTACSEKVAQVHLRTLRVNPNLEGWFREASHRNARESDTWKSGT